MAAGSDWLLVALYIAIFGGVYAIFNLPLGYYSGFVLPHRFGQSNQSFKDWLMDQLKGLAIGAPLGLLMLELLYLALRLTGDLWWLYVAGGLLLFNVILSNLAPVLIMPLFNKYVPLGDEHKDLEERLLDLAKRANTKVKGVFKFDMSKRTKAANAALTGIGNTRRIILGVPDPGHPVPALFDRDLTDLLEQGRLVGGPDERFVAAAQHLEGAVAAREGLARLLLVLEDAEQRSARAFGQFFIAFAK